MDPFLIAFLIGAGIGFIEDDYIICPHCGCEKAETKITGSRDMADKPVDRIALEMYRAGASRREIATFFELDDRFVSRAIRQMTNNQQ